IPVDDALEAAGGVVAQRVVGGPGDIFQPAHRLQGLLHALDGRKIERADLQFVESLIENVRDAAGIGIAAAPARSTADAVEETLQRDAGATLPLELAPQPVDGRVHGLQRIVVRIAVMQARMHELPDHVLQRIPCLVTGAAGEFEQAKTDAEEQRRILEEIVPVITVPQHAELDAADDALQRVPGLAPEYIPELLQRPGKLRDEARRRGRALAAQAINQGLQFVQRAAVEPALAVGNRVEAVGRTRTTGR